MEKEMGWESDLFLAPDSQAQGPTFLSVYLPLCGIRSAASKGKPRLQWLKQREVCPHSVNSGERWYCFSTPVKIGLTSLIPFGLVTSWSKIAAGPPEIVAVFKEERCGGGRRAKPAVDFYHEVRPFSEACFLFYPLHIST